MDNTNNELVENVKQAIIDLEYDVTARNTYMNVRDRMIYNTGLWETLDIEGWFAEYNYLRRVVDIHADQLMGRGFNVYSYYEKEDLSPYEGDDNALQLAELRNKKAKANADARKKAVAAIMRDNGGNQMYKNAARVGSAYGETIIKQWFDKTDKKIKQVLIESPQNYRALWQDNNFRDRDGDAYVWQISADKAYRDYGDKLPEGAMFETSKDGQPWGAQLGDNNTADPIDTVLNQSSGFDKPRETDREMCTVIDFVGYIKGWAAAGDGKVKKVQRGKETRLGITVVGGYPVQIITNEDLIPKYYRVPNRVEPRRSWGKSDIPQSAIDINKEVIQLEADSMQLAGKTLFKKIQAKGFTPDSIPKFKSRKNQIVAMAPEQSLEELQMNMAPIQEMRSLIQAKLDAFVRVTGVGRVLFDDPTVNANSNQALMTTMKGVIDIVEDKQSRWEPVLRDMFTDALYLSAKFIPELKDIVETDENWFLCIEWPSVLRREDAAYQTMYINRFNAGTMSLETYLEKMGDYDTGEEIDRIRDELKDPVTAAVLGRQLGEMAHQTINKSLGIPPWGYVIPKVNLRGDLAPTEVGNMANEFGWDQGPYGPGIGPQGNQGLAANDNFINAGMIQGNAYDGAMSTERSPQQGQQPQGPQITPDQNQVQPISQPGSGATATSAQGAVNKTNQNHGG